MNTIDDEGKALVESKCCAVCKHCFYSGLPGAYACKYTVFTDLFDTCEHFELSDEYEDIG